VSTDFHEIARPQRWDVAFDPDLTPEEVERVLSLPLFAGMDKGKFPRSMPLDGIVRNDCAVRRYGDKQMVVRQGDYGSSAFLIVSGQVRVYLEGDISDEDLGHTAVKNKSLLRQVWRSLVPPVQRAPGHLLAVSGGDERGEVLGQASIQVFFQDLPLTTKRGDPPPVMSAGTVFGEVSALGRAPRSATVVADGPCEMIEIRWQGLRDLRAYDKGFKTYVDGLYRERSLQGDHFKTLALFAELPESAHELLQQGAVFESHGSFEWSNAFKKSRKERLQNAKAAVAVEPVIAGEGGDAEWFYLIRAGFARVCHRVGAGEVTSRYLSKGGLFGESTLRAMFDGRSPRYRSTLRALGYVDIIKLPIALVAKLVKENPKAAAQLRQTGNKQDSAHDQGHQQPLQAEVMEYGTAERLYNGTSIMTIDLDRCTRCDDCVSACSRAHGGQPRFVRHGQVSLGFLFPNACMHCQDPVCMIGCPTGAISRNSDGGQVVVNDQTCIGCSTCANSCPYENIRMVERRHLGTKVVDQKSNPVVQATKCDLCYDQLGGPACVRACPHDALNRGDFAETLALTERRKGN